MRERWGSTFFLKIFKPRSGDISMHRTALFTGIGEKECRRSAARHVPRSTAIPMLTQWAT
jgi:hypothetical protein